MTNMTPATGSEKKLLKAIQSRVGAAEDGTTTGALSAEIAE